MQLEITHVRRVNLGGTASQRDQLRKGRSDAPSADRTPSHECLRDGNQPWCDVVGTYSQGLSRRATGVRQRGTSSSSTSSTERDETVGPDLNLANGLDRYLRLMCDVVAG
jgi:hypothetical protein